MDQREQPNRPTHTVYHVRGKGKDAYWTKVGAAWIHEDGEGMNLSLDFIPVNDAGRLVVRTNKADSQTHREAVK
jgi:hypothetical protein